MSKGHYRHKSLSETFVSGVDKEDEEHVQYLRFRKVPFSRSPFDHYAPEPDDSRPPPTPTVGKAPDHGEHQHTRPFWLELSADLAWSAAFASLTNNREITGLGDITNYAVFFALMWQLWASQAAYDIKFYTNDWWHRIFFILQLLTYGTLSSFTADFDVFWWLGDFSSEIFTLGTTPLTASALVDREERSKEISFMGVSVIMCISRLLLLSQYLRVEYHRFRCKHEDWHCPWCKGCRNCWHCRHCEHLTSWGPSGHWVECKKCLQDDHCERCWRCYAILFSISASALIFLGCFTMLRFGTLNKTTSVIQFSLWTLAMFIEVAGQGFAGQVDESLKQRGKITERLSTLTVIVMGEGLNSICAVSKSTVNAVGVGFKMIAILSCLGITLFCIWLCYFDGYNTKLSYRKPVRQLWFLLHFPFHLSLILVLEGLKNMLLQSNLVISTGHLWSIFTPTGLSDRATPEKLMKNLGKLGISYAQFLLDSKAAEEKGGDFQKVWYQRFALTVTFKQFEEYRKVEEETQYMYDQYQNDESQVLKDLMAVSSNGQWGPGFRGILASLEKPLYDATTFLVPTAGGVILLIGILNYVQRRPRDRFDWGTILNKVLGGFILIVLVSINLHRGEGGDLGATVWRLPTIAFVLLAVTGVDLALFWLSLRSLGPQTKRRTLHTTTGEEEEGSSLIQQPPPPRQGLPALSPGEPLYPPKPGMSVNLR